MRRVSLAAAFLCILSSLAAAQGISVAYVEGQASVSRGAVWAELSVGDALANSARLRLTDNAYLELQVAAARIILSRPGTYSLAPLVAAHTTMDAAKAGASLSTALVRMVKGSVLKQSAVMGVLGRRMPSRGDEQSQMQAERIARAQDEQRMAETEGASQGADLEAPASPPAAASEAPAEQPADAYDTPPAPSSPMIGNDTQSRLEAGKLFLSAGEYGQAVDELMNALGSASAEEMPEVRYYLACSRSLSGDTRGALKLIDGLDAPQGAAWALDYAIFKAKLLADANAFAEALAVLAHFGPTLSRDAERAPVYYFLLGVGYRGVGNMKLGRQNLSKVVSLSRDSDLGKAAAKLLQSR